MTEKILRELIADDLSSKRITKAELARRAGCSRSYISLWLSGKAEWNPEKLVARLKRYYLSETLSVRDRLALERITAIVNNADNRDAVIAAIESTIN
jgi:transcriptional regulator with XRE-family HTH domain